MRTTLRLALALVVVVMFAWLVESSRSATFTVTNTNDSGAGSLRQAILDANASSGADTITFNIPGSGVHTINPTSALPTIAEPVLVDGYTQSGASANTLAVGNNAVLLIELNGNGLGANGLQLTGTSTVRGLVINGFGSGGGSGITIVSGSGNIVEGNFIGTNATGTAAVPNTLDGVAISQGASNNIIGGTTPSARNVISGNSRFGVLLQGQASNVFNNVVEGNFIGTDASGQFALGNMTGVGLVGATSNTIGGTAPGARNVISGNAQEGIHSNSSSRQTIQGNYIGTDATGTAAIPNGFNGINLFTVGPIPSANNLIGGPLVGAGNLISGNRGPGIAIGGTGSDSNVIQGNLIGTDVSGSAPLGNTQSGISMGTAGNLIGGTAGGMRNVISGNSGNGITIFGSASTGNVVQGNFIGTDVGGASALPNNTAVLISGASGNTIGGAAGNLIAFNRQDGVLVDSAGRNPILSNSIFANGGLGIRLSNNANNNQAAPVITSISSAGGFTSIQGTATGPPNTTGVIQFFANVACDPSGSGEGQIFLGSLTAEFGANGSTTGNPPPLPGTVAPGQFVTATTTDANNNTSGFSVCRAVTNTSFSISGRVLDGSGNGIGGISLSVNGAATVNTDGNGNYTFANIAAGGNYTVTPSSANYSFSPTSQTFDNLNVNRIANFVGTQTLVSIKGQVTDENNAGINNVTLALTKNGVAAGTVQTNALGNYSFTNLAVGANYVVTPAGSFTPSSQTFSNLTTNATANFKAAATIPPQCNTTSFAATSDFAGSANPASVAVGDFNGDGKSDLAVANNTSNNVSIFVGTGTGSFSAATNFLVGSGPISVAVGEFDGDGRLDLVVANQDSNNVSILIGTGTGSFSAATNFAVGTGPRSVAVGEFNGDGKLDLATSNISNPNPNNVSILLGTGTGSFSAATNFAVGASPFYVTIGDFNNDGKSDLAVANLAVANVGSGNVSILLGTGTGSFSAATNFPVGSSPISVAVFDFNGDGNIDLAVANSGSGTISILLGAGTGGFAPATNFAVGGPVPLSVAVGDFNSDGKSDLATANFGFGANFGSKTILLNDGTVCNAQSSLTSSGRIVAANDNPLAGVTVTLSGPITRVGQSDVNGNYSFANLVPGGNYAVTVQSPYYVFTPSRVDFFNLSSSQTANFTAAPVAVPAPTPPLSDDFTSPVRDPNKWNLGTQTQPAAAVDPQVTTAQLNGQLVITPLNQASGMHYNGYVAANSFDLRNGKASVEIVKAATGGADTIFAIGSDSNNFFRFMVHTLGAPTSLAPVVKNAYGIEGLLDTTTTQLVFQVKVNGQLTSLSIDYDPVVHRFMRFRHEPPAVAPTNGGIVFETSPNNIDFTVKQRVLLEKGVSPMTAELSAGTSSPTNPGQAVFDNLTLTTSTFQFSAGGYTVGEGDGSVLITVTRAGAVTDAASVDYATADGTARQGTKYLNAAGTLTFAAGQTSRTFSVLIVDTDLAEGNQALDLVLSNPTGAGFNSPGRAVLNIVDNDTVLTPIFQAVALAANQVTINTWTVSGTTYAYLKLSFPNAGYRVVNFGLATRAGNDFTGDAAVEKFTGASVQAVTTTAGIYDLGALTPGSYNFIFKNNGTVVKSQAFTVAAPPFPANPIDTAREFVKQQYRDFLNREADQAGEDFWTDNITLCSDPARLPAGQTVAQCTLRQRETTSGAFFLSPEFQYTGYYVYRMYQGGLGRQPKLSEFTPDAQFVGAGILVNGQLSGAKINQNKADFAQQFVNCTDATKYRCAEFKAIYDSLNNQQYVDKLFQTTGVNASASDRAALVSGLNANPATETRASVLQKVVDGIVVISEGNQQFTTTYGQTFYNSESNRAFVQLEYFGYMKRDPDDAGYAFWLDKLNQFSGNFVNAEMVLAFISSPEYRARFGQP